MNASHVLIAAPLFSAGLFLSFLGFYRRVILKPIYLYWALFAAGVFCFLLVQADRVGLSIGPIAMIAAIIGLPACGMSWLLSRALFRAEGTAKLWPIGVVAALFLSGALISIVRHAGIGEDNAVMNMVMTIHGMTASTVLLLALVEPVEGFRRNLPRSEKLFRLIFILGYATLVAVSVIWEREILARAGVNGAEALSIVQVTCAMIALGGATLAVIYRGAHPMPASTAGRPAADREVSDADRALAARIQAVMGQGDLHIRPDLKVGDLAERLGEPDYKVTRAITGVLEATNFNRLINSYRIEHAKQLLADPACKDWSILSIALDCGFGSIGPFNKAFKDSTGQTPGAWRKNALTRPAENQLAAGISVARDSSR